MNDFFRIGDIYQGGYVMNDYEMRPEGQWLDKEEYPELYQALRGKVDETEDQFQLPDTRDGNDRRSNLRIKVRNSEKQDLVTYAAKDVEMTMAMFGRIPLEPDEDPLGVSRGCFIALVLAFAFYVLVSTVFWLFFR